MELFHSRVSRLYRVSPDPSVPSETDGTWDTGSSVPKSGCNQTEKLATKLDCNQFGPNFGCRSRGLCDPFGCSCTGSGKNKKPVATSCNQFFWQPVQVLAKNDVFTMYCTGSVHITTIKSTYVGGGDGDRVHACGRAGVGGGWWSRACIHAGGQASVLVVRGSSLSPSSPSPLPFVCHCRFCLLHCLSSSLSSVCMALSSSTTWQHSSTSWLCGLIIVIVCLRGLIPGWVASSSSVFFVIVCLHGLILVVNVAVQQHWLAGWPHCCCCCCCCLSSSLLSVCMDSLSSPWLAAWPHCHPMGVVIVFTMGDVVAVIVVTFAMEMSSSLLWSSCRCCPMDVVSCVGG